LIKPALFGQETGNAPYMNPNLSPEQRAADLVSRMMLEGKVLHTLDRNADAALSEAETLVKDSDVAIVFVDLNSELEEEALGVNIPGFQARECAGAISKKSKKGKG
jgi:hypothetical protein